jgi:hypothetical protein
MVRKIESDSQSIQSLPATPHVLIKGVVAAWQIALLGFLEIP